MKGIILDYSIQRNDGVITAQDGSRYKFTGAEWKADTHPERGKQVDFEVCEGKAINIYMAIPDMSQPVRLLETVTDCQLDVVSSVPPPLPHVEALPFTNSQPDVVSSVPAGKVTKRNKRKILAIVLVCLGVPLLLVAVMVAVGLSREIPPNERSDFEEIYKAGNISEAQWKEITADDKITYFELLRLAWSRRER